MPNSGIFARQRSDPAQSAGSAGVEAVRVQLEQVLADPLFCNSKRYSNLLRFIVDRTLAGQNQDLKERIIGVEVFGRSADYDTSLDPTVRVTATEVRKRLALYYKEPARKQALRIEVPNGSYAAEFRLPEQTSLEQPEPSERTLWYPWAAVAVGILALAALSLRVLSPGPVIDQFWAPLLSGPGLVAFYLSVDTPVDGAPGTASSPSAPVSADSGIQLNEFLGRNGHVSMPDVNAVTLVNSFFQRKGIKSVVRPAGSTSLSDLRSAPGVLLGSYGNEWVVRLGDDLHFRYRRESAVGLRWIEDSAKPSGRNWAVDTSVPYGQFSEDYALISRVLDRITGRWLIMIGGLTSYGTNAACEMVADPKAMASLGAHLPRDWAGKNLQVVVGVVLVRGSLGASHVIATYSW
jgi:hypothetical protein